MNYKDCMVSFSPKGVVIIHPDGGRIEVLPWEGVEDGVSVDLDGTSKEAAITIAGHLLSIVSLYRSQK